MNKDALLQKMIDAPETLTQEEIEAITNDQEMKGLYCFYVELKKLGMHMPEFDTEAELSQLHKKICCKKHWLKTIRRIAAIAAIAVMAMAVGAVILSKSLQIKSIEKEQEKESCTPTENTLNSKEKDMVSDNSISNSPIVYDATLEEILKHISERNDCQIHYNNERVKELRFHLTMPSDFSLEETMKLINQFDNVELTLSNDTIFVN